MDRETLEKVHTIELEIAVEIKRVCNKLGITYFLDKGTLLGAVRHKGFIPWDDDIDIGMLRSDYDRFIKEAEAVLDSKYYLQTYRNDKYYANSFARVRKKDTVFKEFGASAYLENNGIFVDICAYDVLTENDDKRRKQGAFLDRYVMYLQAKTYSRPWGYTTNKFEIFKIKTKLAFYRLILINKSKEDIINAYEKELTLYNEEQSVNLYAHSISVRYGQIIIPRECFDEFIELPFEGVEFTCPGDCDLFLKAEYGNYMVMPPEEECDSIHNILEVKF